MTAESGSEFEVTCPHCGKKFTAEPMTNDAGQPDGFKCPHCRLFVPYARANERDLVQPAE
jgi:uncharacterized Zn-finger protein